MNDSFQINKLKSSQKATNPSWIFAIKSIGYILFFFFLSLTIMIMYSFIYDVCKLYYLITKNTAFISVTFFSKKSKDSLLDSSCYRNYYWFQCIIQFLYVCIYKAGRYSTFEGCISFLF